MAELLSILSREFDYNQLTEDVLRLVLLLFLRPPSLCARR